MQRSRVFFVIIAASALFFAGCLDTADQHEEGESATMAPGTSASMPLMVSQAPWDPEQVTVSVEDDAGLDVEVPERLHAGANDTLTGWLKFNAPEGASGSHTVTIVVDSGEGESRSISFAVHLEEPAEPVEEGDQVTIHVSARTLDGELVLTTQQEIAEAPMAHAEGYQEPMGTEPLGPVPVMYTPAEAPAGQQGLPDEIVAGLLGMGEGHTVTVEVPEFFGPSAMEEPQPREETVQRAQTEQRQFELPRQHAEVEGIITEGAQVGDLVEIPGFPMDYVISGFREDPQQGEIVVIQADVQEGDRLTLQEAWPEAAEVTEVNDDSVHLYITPPQEPGEWFTWVEGWDDATEIAHMDEDVIQLRHSPGEGDSYMQQAQQPGAEPIEVTVVSVEEDTITVSRENPQPLAGQTILVDMTLVGVGAADQDPM